VRGMQVLNPALRALSRLSAGSQHSQQAKTHRTDNRTRRTGSPTLANTDAGPKTSSAQQWQNPPRSSRTRAPKSRRPWRAAMRPRRRPPSLARRATGLGQCGTQPVASKRVDFRTGSSTSLPSKTRRNSSRTCRWPTPRRNTAARRASSRRSRRRSRETRSRSARSSSSRRFRLRSTAGTIPKTMRRPGRC
jgi:hypothetical protein